LVAGFASGYMVALGYLTLFVVCLPVVYLL